ncbi:MAG TPA: phage protease [Phycisphaerae bacterium]|nr:phage protease [Phycisphaerae bacterium]
MAKQTSSKKDADRDVTALAPAGQIALSAAAGPVPETVLIVPWGEVESANGRFTVDEESGRLAVEAFEAHGCDLPIDYEHQTLGGPYTSPTGQAPAAGWVQRLEAVPGHGIVASVKWTEPAARQLADRQYRYLSPVAVVRRSDRKLVALHSVALTNKPAIVGMEAIVARADGPTDGDDAVGVLRQRLALEADCSDRDVLVAATRRLTVLEEESRQREADQRVASAAAVGKLAPAQHQWAQQLCLRDEALFDEWLRTAPVVVQVGRLDPPETANLPPSQATSAARARAEYRANPELAALTSEEAYVADAIQRVNGEQ